MKTFILATTLTLLSGVSYAGYECNNSLTGESLQFTEPFPTAYGDSEIKVIKDDIVAHYYTKLSAIEGDFFSVKTYDIYPYEGDKLSIKQRPSTCGRGFCLDEISAGKSVTLTLNIQGTKTNFTGCKFVK